MTFASEYEFRCSELSILCLRIKLWGQSIGLNIDADHLQTTFTTRLDVDSTITQCVGSIGQLLTEIEVIRRKYEFQPPLEPTSDNTQHDEKLPTSSSMSAFSPTRSATTLRQRIRDNQKQKSCLTIAQWTICDAGRFDEKVKRLKTLIDGLEAISTSAGIRRLPPTIAPEPLASSEDPPPYSFGSIISPQISLARASIPQHSAPAGEPHTPFEPSRSSVTTLAVTPQDPEVSAHYKAMMQHCGLLSGPEGHPKWRAREKMTRLADNQFKDLRTDVYDEIFRRELKGLTPHSLPANTEYHPKRNQAREKLSSLPLHRFEDLVIDVLFELERRFPSLHGSHSPRIFLGSQARFSEAPAATCCRYGCVSHHEIPPPLLQNRVAHRKTRKQDTPKTGTLPFSRFSQPPDSSGQDLRSGGVEIFKSLRVSMAHPTSKVLPAALAKHNINAPWENYSLFIVYGDKERRLGLDEKPLVLFKDLDRKGLKPMFLLRKIESNAAGSALEVATNSENVL